MQIRLLCYANNDIRLREGAPIVSVVFVSLFVRGKDISTFVAWDLNGTFKDI